MLILTKLLDHLQTYLSRRQNLICIENHFTNSKFLGDEISLNDPDDILDQFVNQQQQGDNSSVKNLSLSKDSKQRSGSVTTIDTEPWLRPGSTN